MGKLFGIRCGNFLEIVAVVGTTGVTGHTRCAVLKFQLLVEYKNTTSVPAASEKMILYENTTTQELSNNICVVQSTGHHCY